MDREINASELLFLKASQLKPLNMQASVNFTVPVEAKNVRLALKKLRPRHPLSAVRVIAEPPIRVTTDEVPEIPLREVTVSDTNDEYIEIVRELQANFDFETGPLLRVLLLSSSRGTWIVITANHVFADGISMLLFLNELLFLIAFPDSSLPVMGSIPNWEQVFENYGVSVSESVSLRESTEVIALLSKRRQMGDLSLSIVPDLLPISSCSWSLSSSISRELFIRCRTENVSVTSLVGGIAASSVERIEKPRGSKLGVCIPINLRGRLGVPQDGYFGWLAHRLIFDLKCGAGKPPLAIASEISERIAVLGSDESLVKDLQGLLPSLEALDLPSFASYLDGEHNFRLVSLGRPDFGPCMKELGIVELRANSYFGSEELVLNFASFSDQLFFSLNMPGGSDAYVSGVREEMDKQFRMFLS